MITLNLMHPVEARAIQTWSFENKPLIRIGRASDNDVVLYSSVVSRHHVELRREPQHWEIVSLGINGTYVDGELITEAKVVDGIVFRLASSGPRLQIRLDADEAKIRHVEELVRPQDVPVVATPSKQRPTLISPTND